MFKLRDNQRAIMTLLSGVIGTILAVAGIADVFASFLNIIAALVPPVAGVAIADYWIMGKGRPDLWKEKEGVNWIGVVAWLAGAAVAKWSTFFVPTISGIIVSVVVYCLGAALIKSEKINPIYEMQLQMKKAE